MTPSKGRCRTIMVVEDDRDIQDALCELLRWEGYNVSAASNGKEGLDLLPKMETPCLILLDLMMPIMDGWEFLRTKQGLFTLAPIPVAIISAIQDKTQAPEGAKYYIRKPINIDLLLQVVQEY